MRGNTYGKLFSITSFGESHGPAMGVVIDGVPSNLDFSIEELQRLLDRRAPGRLKGTTSRKEADQAKVLSGIFEGKTLGTPICVVVENTNQKSEDYKNLKDEFRPGHADETTMAKFGIRDHRGGGRASGRETLSRVIGGYFASLIIPQVRTWSSITKLGPFEVEAASANTELGSYCFADPSRESEIEHYLSELKSQGESVGGQVVIQGTNIPKGLGEPSFDKLKADLAKSLMSIGAVMSFSFGSGEKLAELPGSEVSKSRHHFGGMEGGISNGEDLFITVTFKPTSTVGDKAKQGRHDPCIMPRACVVLESMVLITLADHYLRQKAYEIS